MTPIRWARVLSLWVCVSLFLIASTQAQTKKENIVVIMGDEIGIWNIGAYHRGMMAGRSSQLITEWAALKGCSTSCSHRLRNWEGKDKQGLKSTWLTVADDT